MFGAASLRPELAGKVRAVGAGRIGLVHRLSRLRRSLQAIVSCLGRPDEFDLSRVAQRLQVAFNCRRGTSQSGNDVARTQLPAPS